MTMKGRHAFPEYNSQVLSVPKYGAVIFRDRFSIRSMKSARERYVIISFFFGEAEASEKGGERYRFKVKRNVAGLTLNSLIPSQSSA